MGYTSSSQGTVSTPYFYTHSHLEAVLHLWSNSLNVCTWEEHAKLPTKTSPTLRSKAKNPGDVRLLYQLCHPVSHSSDKVFVFQIYY